jgi:hypothetical protein
MTSERVERSQQRLPVREVAEELGLTTHQLLAELAARGYFVKSASSTLEPPVITRLRQELPVGHTRPIDENLYGNSAVRRPQKRGDEDGFWSAVERAQQNRGSSSGRTRDTPSGPITTAILELVIVPQRPAHIRRAEGKYTPEECDGADCISRNWASAWLTGGTDNESDIVEWIRVAQGRHWRSLRNCPTRV